MGHVIAAMRVGQERLAALGCPLDRPVDALGCPHHRGLFRIQIDLRAEAAADVGRDDPHLGLRQSQHERGHQQPLDVRVLAGHVERITIIGTAVARDSGARFDRIRDEPVVDDVELGYVRGFGECRVNRGLVAQRPGVALVAGRAVVDLRRTGFQCIDGVDYRRQDFVIDVDQLGGVLRLVGRFRNHQSDAIADIADLALRQHRMRRLLHRLPVGAGNQPATWQTVDAGQVGAGVDSDDPGRRLRLGRVDLANLCVRMR